MPTETSNAEAVAKIRILMEENGFDAYVIPSTDPHMSEYTAARDNRRTYVSNFTGSAGTAVLTRDRALMWTDGRYYFQAQKEMFPGWELMRGAEPGVPTPEKWALSELPSGSTVAIDPLVTSVSMLRAYADAFAAPAGASDAAAGRSPAKRAREATKVVAMERSLVDVAWGDAQPAAPRSDAMVQPERWSGSPVGDKVAAVRGELSGAGASAVVVCALDEVMWLLNIRGADVPYNPVLVCYCVVTPDTCTLYVDAAKIGEEVAAHLDASGVAVAPYGDVFGAVAALAPSPSSRVWLDPDRTNADVCLRALPNAVSGDRTIDAAAITAAFVLKPTPIHHAKGVKNDVEVRGAEEAHRRDAVALCRYFSWLEAAVRGDRDLSPTPPEKLDEVTAMDVLDAMRAEQDLFVSLSFSNICGVNANGAIIHYRAEPGTCAEISRDAMLLVDSGGQYRDGTTDVTRTFHFGQPTPHQIECYTRVLRGHIAVGRAVFPAGTMGSTLDVLARTALWEDGLDFRHGTGHGVGSFLNVHEGPHCITFRKVPTEIALEPGMLVTNEPGYYEDGAFGIRIENVMVVERADNLKHDFGGKGYYRFRPITLVPLEPKLIDASVLTPAERAYINNYHALVKKELTPLLKDSDPRALAWLERCTKEI